MASALQGELSNIPLVDVLQSLKMNRQRGTLSILGPKKRLHLHVDREQIVCVSPGVPSLTYLVPILCLRLGVEYETLDKILARRGKHSIAEQCERAKLGQSTTVNHAHALYLTECVYDVFTWKKGTFEFVPCRAPGDEFDGDQRAAGLELSLEQTVFEAMRRQDEWKVIRRVIPTLDDVFVVSDLYKSQVIQTAEPAKSILSLCDGEHSVTNIAHRLGLETFTVAQVIASHVRYNCLRPVTAEDLASLAERHREKGDTAGALRFYRRSIELDGTDVEVRRQYASLCRECGDLSTATSEYKILAQMARDREDYARAREFYEAVIAINPSDYDTRRRLYHMLRETAAADARSVGLALAAALERAGLRAEEADVLRELARDEPRATDILERLGSALEAQGDREQAGAIFSTAAKLCADGGDVGRACALYERALRARPENADDRRMLSELREGIYHQRRRRRRLILWAAGVGVCVCAALVYGVYNFVAAIAYLNLRNDHLHWIAGGNDAEFEKSLRVFAQRYPLALITLDIPHYRDALRELLGSRHVVEQGQRVSDVTQEPLPAPAADPTGGDTLLH